MILSVKQARVLAGKTQQEMAESMGIHRHTYAKIEQDPEIATIRQAEEIARITGFDLEQIFFGLKSTFSRKQTL